MLLEHCRRAGGSEMKALGQVAAESLQHGELLLLRYSLRDHSQPRVPGQPNDALSPFFFR